MLNVSEIFVTVQGEGRFLGRPSTFLRLARCNLHCVWCDSAYTWRFDETFPHDSDRVYSRGEEIKEMGYGEVYKLIKYAKPSHVVITGGEPLLQGQGILSMLSCFVDRNWTIEIETAGTLSPIRVSYLPLYYTVSPKLENSGNSLKLRYREECLLELASLDSVFKFVVTSSADLLEIDTMVSNLKLNHDRVYLMAEGVNPNDLSDRTAKLIPLAIERGYRVTTRLQIYAFGNRRGT